MKHSVENTCIAYKGGTAFLSRSMNISSDQEYNLKRQVTQSCKSGSEKAKLGTI
jgi:hypothetical protein